MQAFSNKRVLLLQGPVGPFFARLAESLRAIDAQVFKVNFNAGDSFFHPYGAVNYRGTMTDWPEWLEAYLRQCKIDVVLLFGDCRPIHQSARAVATRLGIEIGVFEEGYVRPDYVTFERFGVNGNSRLPRLPESYRSVQTVVAKRMPVGRTYWPMVWYGFWYFMIGGLGKSFFPHYEHHRRLSVLEALPWIRSVWRKQWYKWVERGIERRLTTKLRQRYFLVPLQVFNDAQVTVHGEVDGIEHFIEQTMNSFAKYAPKDTLLVFKHHPMDRGYRDYTKLIDELSSKIGLMRRTIYLHDQYLPALLNHTRGVVVINSTVGLSALHHGAPTMVCGTALYDIPGLTYQGGLDDFWLAAPLAKPDRELYQRFRDYLIVMTQLNGSFYKRLNAPDVFAGLVWSAAVQGGATSIAPPTTSPTHEIDSHYPRHVSALTIDS